MLNHLENAGGFRIGLVVTTFFYIRMVLRNNLYNIKVIVGLFVLRLRMFSPVSIEVNGFQYDYLDHIRSFLLMCHLSYRYFNSLLSSRQVNLKL